MSLLLLLLRFQSDFVHCSRDEFANSVYTHVFTYPRDSLKGCHVFFSAGCAMFFCEISVDSPEHAFSACPVHPALRQLQHQHAGPTSLSLQSLLVHNRCLSQHRTRFLPQKLDRSRYCCVGRVVGPGTNRGCHLADARWPEASSKTLPCQCLKPPLTCHRKPYSYLAPGPGPCLNCNQQKNCNHQHVRGGGTRAVGKLQ